MWWIDVLGIAAACTGWALVPRWVDFTTRFYRERGLSAAAPPLMGGAFAVAIRAACAVIAVFATVDLIRNLT
jgi:hypothetical protein